MKPSDLERRFRKILGHLHDVAGVGMCVTDTNRCGTASRRRPELVYVGVTEKDDQQIYKVSVDGGKPTKLTDLDGVSFQPFWVW